MEVKVAVDELWNRWEKRQADNFIWHDFIKRERNTVLKEYQFSFTERAPEASEHFPVLVGDQVFSPEDAVDEALRWWNCQIKWAEDRSGLTFTKPQGKKSRASPGNNQK